MKLKSISFLMLFVILALGSCEKMLNPEQDYHKTYDRVTKDPLWNYGLLMRAYSLSPHASLGVNDVATDDAVSNDKFNSFLRMATGEWSAIYNPVSSWDNSLSAILYINKFLDTKDKVDFKWTDWTLDSLYKLRMNGEAYGLRGLFKYHLLVTVAGPGPDGTMMGIPIYNEFVEANDDFNKSRATFAESVNDIYADFDKALQYLTMDLYKDINSGPLPAGYEDYTYAEYNAVFGSRQTELLNGRSIKALKARLALLAASPAYTTDNQALWIKAADNAGAVINNLGGISALDQNGHKHWHASYVDNINLSQNRDQIEMIWRTAYGNSRNRETDNYPPSLYGYGRINPTQNLVDAFPMANGYPINHESAGYDESNPYSGRDPRLSLFICYDGNKISNVTIKTGVGGGTNRKDSIMTSTRTGYYLKKLLREDVNVNPSNPSSKRHYDPKIRATEIFLIYAEAANEAWGPDGTGTNGFSAREVIGAIRSRAGITQPDNYLASIATKEEMRVLIRNERRLELCFEGFRFWDLRRWKADLTETAKGIDISGTTYEVVNVETRAYDNNYMIYGPLPYSEVLKYSNLVQNNNW
jgi:starch-binding outer membrane protein, SusD/RagB family